MPDDPAVTIAIAYGLGLLLAGCSLLVWLVSNPARRTRWFKTTALPHWTITVAEFALYLSLMVTGSFLLQVIVRSAFSSTLAHAADSQGWQVFVYGAAQTLGGLAGWRLFPIVCRGWYADYGVSPTPPPPPAPVLPWGKVLLYAGGTLLAALPLVYFVSLGWTWLLQRLGWPDEPQDLLAIFGATKSPLVLAGLLVVACVLAPLHEELLFRAGLYRYLHQKLGRSWAVLLSGGLFGAVHYNLAGFLPLALLGAILGLAYEATGSIRVVVVAHGLFNLNTVVLVLAGVPAQP